MSNKFFQFKKVGGAFHHRKVSFVQNNFDSNHFGDSCCIHLRRKHRKIKLPVGFLVQMVNLSRPFYKITSDRVQHCVSACLPQNSVGLFLKKLYLVCDHFQFRAGTTFYVIISLQKSITIISTSLFTFFCLHLFVQHCF